MQEEAKATCSICGNVMEGKRWLILNIKEHPDLKEEVINGSIRLVKCSLCNAFFNVDAPFLYHDPNRSFMIYYYPPTDVEASPLVNAELKPMTGSLVYQMRLVTSWKQLREKIRIFEALLDDKTIETLKMVMSGKDLGTTESGFGDDDVFFFRIRPNPSGGEELVFHIFSGEVHRTDFAIPVVDYEATLRAGTRQDGSSVGYGEWRSVNQASLRQNAKPPND